MSNNTDSISYQSLEELIKSLNSPNRSKGNTIIYTDNNAITGIQDATVQNMNIMMDRITKGLYLALIEISVKYIKENRMKFSIGHFNVGDIKIDGDELMSLTEDSLRLVHAYISNSLQANKFISKYSKHEQSEMLRWVSKLLDPNGTWELGVRAMMNEWEKQTDAGVDTLNEILDVIRDKQKQLE